MTFILAGLNLTDGFGGFGEEKIFGIVAETACNCYYSSIKLSFAFKKGHILDKSVSKSILELCFRLMIQ